MSTTTTTISKNSKRGSDVLSDANPDILNATTRPSMDTHKKRRLDDADLTTPTVKPRTIATSIASKTHESRGHTPAGSSTQRQSTSTPLKDVHTHRSETLISTRRVGPSVVVRRYEVIVSRPKAKQSTIHTPHSEPRTPYSKLRRSSASTTSAKLTSTSSGPEASKSHATEPKRNAKASSQQSVATDAMNNAEAPRPNLQPRKEEHAGRSRSKPAGGKDKPRRVPARALAVASKLSAQEVERLMAKVGMEGYKMPPTLARLPSFRKKKVEV